MDEQSKAKARRLLDPRFGERWFVGSGIDIGSGPDPMSTDGWPKVTSVIPYDVELGHQDAQFVPEHSNESFDFVHSSHCLEHMRSPRAALVNWIRILKPGGYIICTVPEEFLYEFGRWPSRFNEDHKASFTLRAMPIIPSSINLINMLWKLPVDLEHLTLLSQGWDPAKAGQDQTMLGAECSIEFVVRKPNQQKPW